MAEQSIQLLVIGASKNYRSCDLLQWHVSAVKEPSGHVRCGIPHHHMPCDVMIDGLDPNEWQFPSAACCNAIQGQ